MVVSFKHRQVYRVNCSKIHKRFSYPQGRLVNVTNLSFTVMGASIPDKLFFYQQETINK